MKRVAMLALVLVFGISCDDSPTSPSDPNVARFTAILLPSNEVPPIVNAEASASGTMQLTMTVTRDSAQNITGATYDFVVHLTGFPSSAALTLAHIHNGPAGVNAGVVVNLALAGPDLVLTGGASTITKTGLTAQVPANAAAVAQSIFNSPGNNYFNVHTQLNGGGVVRGQLVKQ